MRDEYVNPLKILFISLANESFHQSCINKLVEYSIRPKL